MLFAIIRFPDMKPPQPAGFLWKALLDSVLGLSFIVDYLFQCISIMEVSLQSACAFVFSLSQAAPPGYAGFVEKMVVGFFFLSFFFFKTETISDT